MSKYILEVDVNESAICEISGLNNVQDAIRCEMGDVRQSGIILINAKKAEDETYDETPVLTFTGEYLNHITGVYVEDKEKGRIEAYNVLSPIPVIPGAEVSIYHERGRGWFWYNTEGKSSDYSEKTWCSFKVPENAKGKSILHIEHDVLDDDNIDDGLMLNMSSGWITSITPTL